MVGFIKTKNNDQNNIKRYFIVFYHNGESIEIEMIGKIAAIDTLRILGKTAADFHYDEDIS